MTSTAARVVVLHGPNLNLLGRREPGVYGHTTLPEIDDSLRLEADALGLVVDCHQTNIEGELVDLLQASASADAVIINAAAYTHTSVAIRDAIAAICDDVPVIEVHLSIPEAREDFRRTNLLAGVVTGRVEGFGAVSYLLALRAASTLIASRGHSGDQ